MLAVRILLRMTKILGWSSWISKTWQKKITSGEAFGKRSVQFYTGATWNIFLKTEEIYKSGFGYDVKQLGDKCERDV